MSRPPHFSSIDEPSYGRSYHNNYSYNSSYSGRGRNNNNGNSYSKFNNKGTYDKSPKWFCPSCGQKQSMGNSQCEICDTPQPAVILDYATVQKRRAEKDTQKWSCLTCQKIAKESINLGHKQTCFSCNSPRPTPEQVQAYRDEKLQAEEKKRLEEEKQAQIKASVVKSWERTNWDKLRLIFLGAKDTGSCLAPLPTLLLHKLVDYLTYVPPSSGDAVISFFKKYPNGLVRVATDIFEHDYYPDNESGWCLRYVPGIDNQNFKIKFCHWSWKEGQMGDKETGNFLLTAGQFLCWWFNLPEENLPKATKKKLEDMCLKAEGATVCCESRYTYIQNPSAIL